MSNTGEDTADEDKSAMSDQEALEFYNLATGRLLTGLEVSYQNFFLIDIFYSVFFIYFLYTKSLYSLIFTTERSWRRAIID